MREREKGEKKGEKEEGNETQLVSKILQLHQEGKKNPLQNLENGFEIRALELALLVKQYKLIIPELGQS